MAAYLFDEEGKVGPYNTACGELWGNAPETAMDKWCGPCKLYDIMGVSLDPLLSPMAVAARDKKPVNGITLFIEHADGSRKKIVASATPVINRLGKLAGGIAFLLPVTETGPTDSDIQDSTGLLEIKVTERTADLLKKNEELKKSEERYHKMVEEVQDYAILLLDRDGTIMNWNKGAQRIKGYKDEEIIGKNFRVFYLAEDQQNNLPETLIDIAIREGRALHEGLRLRKDGTRFWGVITITALHDDRGEVIGFSKVTRDLTEKKLAEDQIKLYLEELEYQNRELEQFAYAAAHDMREPLRKILYYNNYLADTLPPDTDTKCGDYLQRSISAATRMQRLIDDLLAYSKTSLTSHEPELVSLDNILQDTLISQQDAIRHTHAVINVVPLPVVDGVGVQLQQLFDNLLGNSLKYRNPKAAPLIQITHTLVSGADNHNLPDPRRMYHAITLSDNGVGFDASDAEEIFNLFHRLHTSAEYQGTGIGLAICKKIMQQHHGIITATGQKGEGAAFTLYFPAKL